MLLRPWVRIQSNVLIFICVCHWWDFPHTSVQSHPTSYTMGTGSLRGVKWPGRVFDHPPQSIVEVKERIELYLCSPSGTLWPVLGELLPLPFSFIRFSSSFFMSSYHLLFTKSSGFHLLGLGLLSSSSIFISSYHLLFTKSPGFHLLGLGLLSSSSSIFMSSYHLLFTKSSGFHLLGLGLLSSSSSSIFISSYHFLFTKSSGLYLLALCLFIIISRVFISSSLHKIIRPLPFSFMPFYHHHHQSSCLHIFFPSQNHHHHHQYSCLHILSSSQNHQAFTV